MLPPTRSRAALLAVVTLLAGLLVVVAPTGAASAVAPTTGTVTGVINFPAKRTQVEVLWFTSGWQFIGRKNAGAGSYAITNLPPGRYWLQFVDQRESYDIGKYAATDVQVSVRAGDTTIRNVTMQRGGYITGTVRTGDGRPAAKATVTAANRQGRSFSTTANSKGQFAIGGLPQSRYSVFTWDRRKRWVAKSTWAGAIRPRQGKDVRIRLDKRAGAMRVLLLSPEGSLTARTQVTVTNRTTGQWWTATARSGSAVFQGLYPGRYTLDFPGAGVWLRATGKPVQRATVRPGRTVIGKVKVTQRGGWITGQAVDAHAPAYPLAKAQVQLYDAYGTKVDETTTATDGTFLLDGQLYTQTGMTVVVNPNPNAGGWTQTTGYCQFQSLQLPGIPVTQGSATALGAVSVQQTADSPCLKVS
ncbi:hypothetical protein GON03_08670 [Nocardioides sp. MAH-18]|uniref:Uncharacterized protein n=1 Tax=Nocardioides agri TaxID=2682843 RepID=A0A6L6XPP7_9ACTN|nr:MULTISPECIES: carboxypeptidase-like regulatory domain-containing protein [unclassified Nocardioides]MBA2954393.1 carboxypeptidase regulatory-like domain-containing protein [Nocardioides sp. CGMCC 1.13656]MVQ49254.1 hypothetical protein [Nocardioides sp. MAH-18]